MEYLDKKISLHIKITKEARIGRFMDIHQGNAAPFPFRTGNYFLKPLKKGYLHKTAIGVAEKKDRAPLYIKFLDENLSANKNAVAQFQLEGKILNSIDGKQFPKYTEHGKVNETHYIAYNYVKGLSLKALSTEKPEQVQKNPRFALGVVSQVLAALKALHERDTPVIHGNINPANVILGKKGHIYLVNFSAAIFKTDMSRQDLTMCNYDYLSPEQAKGHSWDEQSDIFQVGILFYELVTGKKWNPGTDSSSQISHAASVCTLPDHFLSPIIGTRLSQLIAQMLRPDPRTRVHTVNEAIQWLESIISKEAL
ncbi:MAG: hypothetical protein D6B28_03255 [Gammaproteobacteria bacterium]|nr:MAG: hypothetical protein D6B28_03255 [Gammaproteobacteria bacterium]